MSLGHGAKITTDGLVLCLDAANPKSYPGSGTTWTDLTGNGNNGTLINGVGYSSDNKGALTFDGVDDYADCGNNLVSPLNGSSELSISVWIYNNAYSDNSRVLQQENSTTGDNWSFSIDQDGPLRFNIFNSVNNQVSDTVNLPINQWLNIFCIFQGGSRMEYWKNANLISSITPSISTILIQNSSSKMALGSTAQPTRFFNGNISQVQIYNRALSAEEIQQNFNATRGRYGI